MIINTRWFPTSMQERAAWMQNFTTQFTPMAVPLGFLPAVVTALAADNEDMQFCAMATVEIDAFSKAFRQYRDILTAGGIGDPTPSYPLNPTLNPPAQVNTGIYERLDDLVKRIRVAPAYTDEVGALLGILPPPPNGFAPETVQPSLKATAMPGSVVEVKFVRGNMTAVALETKLDNSDTWSDAGKFYKSPAELVIPVNTQNLPRSVQVRARFVDGNKPIGQFSDIVTTATQPAG